MLEDVEDDVWVEFAADKVSAYDTVTPSDELFCSEPARLVESRVEEGVEVMF